MAPTRGTTATRVCSSSPSSTAKNQRLQCRYSNRLEPGSGAHLEHKVANPYGPRVFGGGWIDGSKWGDHCYPCVPFLSIKYCDEPEAAMQVGFITLRVKLPS